VTETLCQSIAPVDTPIHSLAIDESDRRLLIVDDEESLRNLYLSLLGERYVCTTAANSEEALVILGRERFALVLSDVIMPGLSGVELLREITTRYIDTAVVMISGVDRTQRVLDAVRLGAYDYLIKPVDPDVLLTTVDRAIERRNFMRDARHYKLDLERRNAELKQRKAELQRLQGQIIQHEKMASLGQLAAGVAHELNNPAGFIFGNMEILRDCSRGFERLVNFYESIELSAEDVAQVQAIKDEIDYENTLGDLSSIIADCHEGAERIRDVVHNLRLFSRLDEAEFKKVDIHEGIESTIRLLARYFGSGPIKLVRDYGTLPLVDCYAGQLNQVWMNLLVNAAQAINESGEVRIQTLREDENVIVTICDTGRGIATDELKYIFDPFFTTKPVGEGTGLGLSVTYSIIERHNGLIQVESSTEKGTSFIVTIPIDNEHDRTEQLT
jgi:two-component system, NtrC family, sensor kinase